MLFEQLKEIIKHLDTIDKQSVVKMITDAGYTVNENELQFVEIVSVVTVGKSCCVIVLLVDTDELSEICGQEYKIMFDISSQLVISNLNYVY